MLPGGVELSKKGGFLMRRILFIIASAILAFCFISCDADIPDSMKSSEWQIIDGKLVEVIFINNTGTVIDSHEVPNAVIATPSTAQDILDSDINGKIVFFDEGSYDNLEINPTKETAEAFKDGAPVEIDALVNTGNYTYYRTIENVRFIASDDAVFNGSFRISTGHRYSNESETAFDPVREIDCIATTTSCFVFINGKSLSFENMAFDGPSAGFDINYYNESTLSDISFIGCSFANIGTTADVQALHLKANDLGHYSKIHVEDCSFTNVYQGIYTQCVDGIMITGCKFDTTRHNAIATQSSNDPFTGTITITNNTIKNTSDRAIRFGNGKEATITVTGNSFENAVDNGNEILKSETLTDCSYSFTSNRYEGKAIPDTTGTGESIIIRIE